ncbi:MAG: L-threonylcarbamoyladenylate synthase, partial [Acidobacteriota bacterium]
MPPYLDACHLDLLDLRRRLSRGAVVIFPTETFYGLGGAPQQATAARILALKGRREGRPLPLIAASPAVARTAVHLDPPARRLWDALTTRWWPGPLTLVARARSGFPPELLAGGQTVGVRVSSNETATTIAELCGGLTVATSANATGTPPALIADDAV